MRKMSVVLLLALAASASHGQEISVLGKYDCGQWFNSPTRENAKTWLNGYLTGANEAWTVFGPSKDPLRAVSPPQAWLWMDNYCRENPLETVLSGGQKLFLEIVDRAKKR
jgi:hypothetical protein